MLARLNDSGDTKIRSARVVASECPEIAGYFVEVIDNLGDSGLLIEASARNISLKNAQAVASEVVGQRVDIWE